MGYTIGAAHDPSVADYRAISPRWRAGRNVRSPLSQKTKSPAGFPAGLFRDALVDYRPWADIEKLKLSKVFSATRNHRFSSARKAFMFS